MGLVLGRPSGRQRSTWWLDPLTCDGGGVMNNTLAKVTLLVFVVFFLALAVARLWMQ
jgi:hypothetical protein